MYVYYFQYDASQPARFLLIFLIIIFYNVISFIVSFMLGPCFILISTFPSFLGL